MKRYETTDTLGNRYTIIVTDHQKVVAHNQHRINLSLANFNSCAKGYAEARQNVRNAARQGLAALNAATFYTWTERS